MPDADFTKVEHNYAITVQAAANAKELRQLANGKAAAKVGQTATAAGTTADYTTTGKYVCPKATGVVLLDGGKAFWDHSARVITYKAVGDRDFYAGTIVGDAASAATTCTVNLNDEAKYLIDAAISPMHSIPVGTHAAGGFGYARRIGGTQTLVLSSTSEAQKIDLFSLEKFAVTANPIVEFAIRVQSAPAGACDFNIGVANDTHATDFDSLTQRLSVFIDGGNTSNFLQSEDGTVSVTDTDTTTDFTAGYEASVREEWWFDCRNPADVQVYRNGVLVLDATVFDISHMASELRLIAHLEKTATTDTAQIAVDWLRVRTAEQ